MSIQSYSSLSTGRRRGTLHDDIDRSVYTVGQTLASIVNDPRTAGYTGGFWGLGHDASVPLQPPPLDPSKYPPVTKADVQRYIDLVHGAYDRFMRDRQSLEAFDAKHRPGSSGSSNQGEPFMEAVQAVPVHFFQEGFLGGWDDFFKQYCQEQSADELYEQIDQLNRNLDVVELQLLREVASRSDSFFQAAASLQHLLGMLGESMSSIRQLRRSLAEADEQMYSTAVSVKALQQRRSNLQATLDITKGLEEVMAAQQALDCMLEGQDYAGALELLDQMKGLLEQPALMGLQCIRHIPPRLVDTTTAVERALANEFLHTLVNHDVARVVAEAASDAEAQPDASISTDGQATAGSAWQLPVPTDRSSSTATEQLHEKLLPLALGLYRSERLGSTLQQYKANIGDEVKTAVRDAVQQVLPVLLAASGDVPAQQQAAGSESQLADQLQLLHHGAFMVLLHAAARVIYSCVDHAVLVGQLLEGILTSINTPTSQLAALRKEWAAALQVVVDVGLGRWVKLLAARSAAHTRIRQYELRQLLDLSEQVASYTESLGARTLGTFRSALQNQCKALLDSSHARALNQLQHLLESEQWVSVEVPGSFQAIVDRLVARCGEGAALLDGRTHLAAPAGAAAADNSSTQRNSTDGASAAGHSADGFSEQHSPKLKLSGKSFHLVNSALMLLKMLDEYMSLYDLMPQFGAEIVHRELELLKLFNSQTCALVLGAGAMRTAGLRSISAKQLALSCQAVGMLATLLPLLRAGSLALVSQPRRALLMPEFDRLLQDLTMHMDEVHSKLVDIMRDRLAAATQALPGEVKALSQSNALGVDQPSPTIGLLVKQLGTLRTVLVPYLLKEEVEFIFGAVARAYSDALSETFEVLMAQDMNYEAVVRADALAMLQAFRDLPLDPTRSSNYCSRLTTTYTKHFGLPPWDQERLGQTVKQQQQHEQQPEQHVHQQHEFLQEQGFQEMHQPSLQQQAGHQQQEQPGPDDPNGQSLAQSHQQQLQHSVQDANAEQLDSASSIAQQPEQQQQQLQSSDAMQNGGWLQSNSINADQQQQHVAEPLLPAEDVQDPNLAIQLQQQQLCQQQQRPAQALEVDFSPLVQQLEDGTLCPHSKQGNGMHSVDLLQPHQQQPSEVAQAVADGAAPIDGTASADQERDVPQQLEQLQDTDQQLQDAPQGPCSVPEGGSEAAQHQQDCGQVSQASNGTLVVPEEVSSMLSNRPVDGHDAVAIDAATAAASSEAAAHADAAHATDAAACANGSNEDSTAAAQRMSDSGHSINGIGAGSHTADVAPVQHEAHQDADVSVTQASVVDMGLTCEGGPAFGVALQADEYLHQQSSDASSAADIEPVETAEPVAQRSAAAGLLDGLDLTATGLQGLDSAQQLPADPEAAAASSVQGSAAVIEAGLADDQSSTDAVSDPAEDEAADHVGAINFVGTDALQQHSSSKVMQGQESDSS